MPEVSQRLPELSEETRLAHADLDPGLDRGAGLGVHYNPMTEKALEAKFVKECHKRGLLTYKFVSPSNRGVSDRIVIGKHGIVGFYELKRPGQYPTALQAQFLFKMRERGCASGLIYTVEDIKTHLDYFQKHDTDPLA